MVPCFEGGSSWYCSEVIGIPCYFGCPEEATASMQLEMTVPAIWAV